MQKIDILKCSYERLRLVVPFWNITVCKEALGIIQATFKKYGDTMSDIFLHNLLRKQSIIKHELHRHMRHHGIARSQMYDVSRKMINNTTEGFIKIPNKGRG